MTAQVLFRQLVYIDRLKRGGFTDDQARASADALEAALSDVVATKADVDGLQASLTEETSRLAHDISETRAKLEHEISETRVTLGHEISETRAKLEHEISETRATLGHEIVETKSQIRNEISEVESRLAAQVADVKLAVVGVRLEIAQAKNDMLRWMFGFTLALIGAIFAIVKFVR